MPVPGGGDVVAKGEQQGDSAGAGLEHEAADLRAASAGVKVAMAMAMAVEVEVGACTWPRAT